MLPPARSAATTAVPPPAAASAVIGRLGGRQLAAGRASLRGQRGHRTAAGQQGSDQRRSDSRRAVRAAVGGVQWAVCSVPSGGGHTDQRGCLGLHPLERLLPRRQLRQQEGLRATAVHIQPLFLLEAQR